MKTPLSKILILLVLIAFSPLGAFAAQIFMTNYPSEANAKVFVTKYPSEANCIVYETQYSSDNEPGVWFYTKYKSDARAVIYYTQYKSDADLIVYYTKYKSVTRCRYWPTCKALSDAITFNFLWQGNAFVW